VVFLRHAAAQREPIIVLGDDDIFLQPRALLSYMWTLLSAGRSDSSPLNGSSEWYAGRFDWYSWRTETMQATAYWRAMRGALYGAQEWFRNCSPTGAGWVRGGKDGRKVLYEAPPDATPPHERCVGPFACGAASRPASGRGLTHAVASCTDCLLVSSRTAARPDRTALQRVRSSCCRRQSSGGSSPRLPSRVTLRTPLR
jgi:hypothetical protein